MDIIGRDVRFQIGLLFKNQRSTDKYSMGSHGFTLRGEELWGWWPLWRG